MLFVEKHYILIIGILIFLVILYTLSVIFPLNTIKFTEENIQHLDERTQFDIQYVSDTILSMEIAYQSLIDSELLHMTIENTTPQKTQELKTHFAKIIDHIIILENFMEEYEYFYQINYLKYPTLNKRAFLIAYTPYVAKYKILFMLSKEIGNNEYVKTILNEEIHQQTNLYHKLKLRYEHPNTIISLNAGAGYLKFIGTMTELEQPLITYSQEAYSMLFGGIQHNIFLGFDNILDVFEKETIKRWLPTQKHIANILGETKITSRPTYFITQQQIEELYDIVEPGDIMFQRRNWYVSNVGMPGFWTHAALYVGTLEKLDVYFQNESQTLLNMSVSQYVKKTYPKVYEDKITQTKEGYYKTTIEGKAEGIIMLPLEISAYADYLSFIRPKLSKEDKLKALLYTFENYEVPYDYNFDFSTDDALVCSELVYKAYLATPQKNGLQYHLTTVAGRWMLAPNDMVKTFDENFETINEQNTFVVFYDGNETTQGAVKKGVKEFRESWKRSKYTIMHD